MKKSINTLYNSAMGSLMEREAKTHGSFFTQKEFIDNQVKIFELTSAKREIFKTINNGI